MKPGCWLSCSQEPATGPCSEPDESNKSIHTNNSYSNYNTWQLCLARKLLVAIDQHFTKTPTGMQGHCVFLQSHDLLSAQPLWEPVYVDLMSVFWNCSILSDETFIEIRSLRHYPCFKRILTLTEWGGGGQLYCCKMHLQGLKEGLEKWKVKILNQLHGAESFLRSHQSLIYSRISQHFMEPEEGSLPCSQEPSTGPILSQINPVYFISLRSILILWRACLGNMAFVYDSFYGNQATVECDVNNMADARAAAAR
jgi:hypothetical protein